ncbi:molybdopterin-guanine dinucleotide biosynthesis protein B [Staphylococcus pettenkoferi]|uniref:molybdopterin-guanine dinucleotide biosynthesis protein B n=1 Tax=Staphylococcus pettenkoferi TaxID=170573 RepID=UPI00119D6106|nr:molybdopterin-guanine dinucleotide biosynthesis protein B [Staphylococcus pettenkoferi]MBX8993988.1 molybdopterin-guanine dinucleotide biosynthesis protein B [Staphylococcus pettenkoferi]MCY1568000.1 molybdopterin-guanine dinucleotide biosynthesis protein B [Staphylococcus pettenkoferi]MCY1588044.1 molybdopterin-guanine dinucleotide biosynthesis protein B [Staphylococcus pettenkoferi]MCY1604188.1 molybdopterin-guanine dinucleotide biosynthesis protein B [Staphylococcus pettenkoferi]
MILQVVGYKNSGKTTLMQHIVKQAKSLGLAVATVKHHGHQGEDIALQEANVDHMKHFRAGADQSIVQGNDYQQTVTRSTKQNLSEIINQSVTIDCQLILVEGFKQAAYPKIIVAREAADMEELSQLTEVKYQLNWDTDPELQHFDQWLLKELEGLK